MSLLIFDAHPTAGITVLTDTLITAPDGDERGEVSKAFLFPHLAMILCTTGHWPFGHAWAQELSNIGQLGEDIVTVSDWAPQYLAELYRRLIPTDDDMTSTVYHFGFDQTSERFVVHVFRSTADFELEVLEQGGFGVKPHPVRGGDELDDCEHTLEGFIRLAELIRAEQQQRSESDRVHIGGRLMVTQLSHAGGRPTMVTTPVHRFASPPG